MRSSRYIRPATPSHGLVLSERDQAILGALHTYRYLRAAHVHQLVFADVSLRRVQMRLRQLWEHAMVERYYRPIVFTTGSSPPRTAGEPVYALGAQGAGVVAEEHAIDVDEIRAGFQPSHVGLPTLEHHLIAIDMLIALTVACRTTNTVRLVSVEPEATLWRKLAPTKVAGRYQAGYLVSDGAFTLSDRSAGAPATFHLEIVRASVKGGNRELARKLREYVRLHHEGYFRSVFRQERVRAILIATTSRERAENFRTLARALSHGRRLFWFGTYELRAPEQILLAPWRTTDGEVVSIGSSSARPAGAAASATHS